ncbi:hypothetical protein, partial [Mycobacteroides sp. H101]|uniref:hypothetical protein n=1 Tax=Mycobacteroides sp. H101 TaxID=1720574 RepID=UPI00196A14D5
LRVHAGARAPTALGCSGRPEHVATGDPQLPDTDPGPGAHTDVVTGHLLVSLAALPNQRVEWLG